MERLTLKEIQVDIGTLTTPSTTSLCPLFFFGGTRNYEITHANSGGGMPSTKTVRRKLAQFDQSAEEGARNVRLLKDYLDSNNYPPIVCLSTDATQIIPR